jgi:L-aminopeptidase/D-esterase-like protein
VGGGAVLEGAGTLHHPAQLVQQRGTLAAPRQVAFQLGAGLGAEVTIEQIGESFSRRMRHRIHPSVFRKAMRA